MVYRTLQYWISWEALKQGVAIIKVPYTILQLVAHMMKEKWLRLGIECLSAEGVVFKLIGFLLLF